MSEYLCDVCGKAFSSIPARSGHQRVHQSLSHGKIHECSTCGRAFSSLSSLHTHKCEPLIERRAAYRESRRAEHLKNGGYLREQELYCSYCNKICRNYNSLTQHEIRCKKNPDKINTYVEGFNMKRSYESQKTSWNRGLTKQTDPRIAAASNAISQSMTGRPGHAHTEAEKLHLSEIAKQRGLGGFNMRSKGITYNGIKLDSTYELAVVQSLDQFSISWGRCGKFLYKTPDGIERTYTPDFYLPDYDIYLDPKNDFLIKNINPRLGYKDVDKIQWVMEQNQVKILILDKDHLTWDKIKILIESMD